LFFSTPVCNSSGIDTYKEIAQAVGKTERSVQMWAKKVGEKISSVGEKSSSAGHGKPADYTMEETLAIIEAGMGKNAAGIFRANAEKSEHDTPSLTAIIRETITAMVPVLVEVVPGTSMETNPHPEKQVFSRMEAAAYLGIHWNTLDKSDIPRVRMGGRILFRRKTLDKYLADVERKWKPDNKKAT
jgi:hypothetical protein